LSSFPALTHVAVTVTDLARSVEWYRRLLDSDPVLDEDTGPFHHTVFALGNGTLLGLHLLPGTPDGDRFDEHRVGLDHVSFGCADRAELDRWQARLDELGIEHGGVVDAHYGSGLSFRDPDNIALEFFAPPG
jgi:glyoxylase I family protein